MAGHKIHKRRMVGVVTSDKMNKTAWCWSSAASRDAQVRQVHDQAVPSTRRTTRRTSSRPATACEIVESRPLSRDKRWRVEKLIERPQEA